MAQLMRGIFWVFCVKLEEVLINHDYNITFPLPNSIV